MFVIVSFCWRIEFRPKFSWRLKIGKRGESWLVGRSVENAKVFLPFSQTKSYINLLVDDELRLSLYNTCITDCFYSASLPLKKNHQKVESEKLEFHHRRTLKRCLFESLKKSLNFIRLWNCLWCLILMFQFGLKLLDIKVFFLYARSFECWLTWLKDWCETLRRHPLFTFFNFSTTKLCLYSELNWRL